MRKTIILHDDLGQRLLAEARSQGISFSAFMAEAGRLALGRGTSSGGGGFELLTFGQGGVRDGIDLDRTSELLAAEDKSLYGDSEA